MKHVICEALPEGIEHLEHGATIQPKAGGGRQMHFVANDDTVVTNSVYEARWDGKADKLTALKGRNDQVTHRYAGWPDKE